MKRIISILLILCISLSSTAIASAQSYNVPMRRFLETATISQDKNITKENGVTTKTSEETFTLDGKIYHMMIVEGILYNEGKLFDEKGNLINQIKCCKANGELTNFQNIGRITSYAAVADADGYTCSGSYTYNLGYITSAAGLVLALSTAPIGITVPTAISIVGSIGSFTSAYFDVNTDIWRKIDSKYEYVKRYVKLYEIISGNYRKVAGPYELLQKKAIDA